MDLPKKAIGFLLILLVISDASNAWSQKTGSIENLSGKILSPESKVTEVASERSGHLKATESTTSVAQPETLESKVNARYAENPGDKYILEEDDHLDGGKDDKGYEESEEHEEHQERDHLQGYHNVGKKVEDENTKDYQDKGGYSEFKEGGATFDKHHKDHIAENKENEDIKAHDAGEKFGSEALKEHKLGKHREKSKGHKKHGFKNVYHKEEYGDHKTFHDEFLDNDHHHEYDDQHENHQMQGGKFSKGFKKEGENKEFGEGDEKHAWGKEGNDGYLEGNYQKGGHQSGHHLGHKKNEGHHEANGQKNKHLSRKSKKGKVPQHSHGHGVHHGNDQPQYYFKSNNAYGNRVHPPNVPSQHVVDSGHGGHHYQSGHSVHDPEPHAYQDGGHLQEEVFEEHEERTPHKERPRGSGFSHKHSKHKHVHPEWAHADGRLPAVTDDKLPLYPQSESVSISGNIPKTPSLEKHQVQYGLPRQHQHHSVQPQSRQIPLIHHRHHPAVEPNRDVWSSHFSEREPYRHVNLNHHHGHSHFKPHVQQHRLSTPIHPDPVSHLRSSPYPWWRHSSSPQGHQIPTVSQLPENFGNTQARTNLPQVSDDKRYNQPSATDESQASSYRHMTHARAPLYLPRY